VRTENSTYIYSSVPDGKQHRATIKVPSAKVANVVNATCNARTALTTVQDNTHHSSVSHSIDSQPGADSRGDDDL